jgi:hypothetical protein
MSTWRILNREFNDVLRHNATGTELSDEGDLKYVSTVFRLHRDYRTFEGGVVLSIRIERAEDRKGFRLFGRNGVTAFMTAADVFLKVADHIRGVISCALREFGSDCSLPRARQLLRDFLEREGLNVLDLTPLELESGGLVMSFVCADAEKKAAAWRALCGLARERRV